MSSLTNDIKEYTAQLSKGQIQRAYKGIMTFMSDLESHLERKYPGHTASALYFGYMDMTYFAFTPSSLKSKKLKIAIVFLHEECKFELWLAGNNRQIQADYIDILSQKNLGSYTLSQVQPGVDSIVVSSICEHPDFDHFEKLKDKIATKTIEFIKDIECILE